MKTMSDPKAELLMNALSRLLREQLAQSSEMRDVARALGQWLLQEADRSDRADASAATPGPTTDQSTRESAAPTTQPRLITAPAGIRGPVPVLSSATVPLKIGDTLVHVPVEGTTQEIGRARQAAIEATPGAPTDRTPLDLALIVKRSTLKAESCRLYIKRRGVTTTLEDAELKRQMDEQIATAKATPNCFLWVFWRERPQPDDDALRRIAFCYEALAACAELVRRRDELYSGRRSEDEATILGMLAEASSALRIALKDSWLSDDDRDQADSHVWLRQETAQRRIFIARHMAVDDPADPAGAQALLDRAIETKNRLEEQAGKIKTVRNLLGQVRYHANQIVKAGGVECDSHWLKITSAIKSLNDLGVPSTDERIATHLGTQAAALLPEDATAKYAEDLTAVIRGVQEQQNEEADEGEDERAPSERVLQVRSWLRGKRLVLVGGEPRQRAIQKLTDAFELGDVEWVFLTEHGSGVPMRGPIERADTAVVVVIIKLTGHLHADEAREYAMRADKPVVLLKSGYNAEQIAHAIIEQVSDRFGAAASAK